MGHWRIWDCARRLVLIRIGAGPLLELSRMEETYMRTTTRFLGSFACSLLSISAVFAQTNPPPPDPHEMVTREPRTLTKPADRSAALDLLDRARQNFNLHDISTPYALKVSFETNGATEKEGEWTMDEISDGGAHWRWMTMTTTTMKATAQDSVVIRIGANGRVYGTNPSAPVPLRVQLVRSALHWPIMRNAGASAIRAADVERDGQASWPWATKADQFRTDAELGVRILTFGST